jgi:hypothetical protein
MKKEKWVRRRYKPFFSSISDIMANPMTSKRAVYAAGVLASLRRQWETALGNFYEFSYPYKLSNGVLYVAVKEQMMLMELEHVKAEIIERFREVNSEVVDIRFTKAAAKKPDNKVSVSTFNTRELSNEELEWISRVSSVIKSESLRDAFKGALLACLKYQ